MRKTALAALAAITIAGASMVYAQGPGGGTGGGPDGARDGMRWRSNAEDIGAFADARIAGLKAGLRLTPEQDKHWPALEAALRAMAKQRVERYTARASTEQPTDPVDRLSRRADMLSQNGALLKALANAAAPLYQSLDDGQKRRFNILSRLDGRRFAGRRGGHDHGQPHHRFGHHDGDEPGHHRGSMYR
jgi:hypothetical protein